MKRKWVWLFVLTCVVVNQKKTKAGYLTECKGSEVNGHVLFAKKIATGRQVIYVPHYQANSDFAQGEIKSISAHTVYLESSSTNSTVGKEP